jgi:hypothetical protein
MMCVRLLNLEKKCCFVFVVNNEKVNWQGRRQLGGKEGARVQLQSIISRSM